jgi:hypothetical protein
MFLTTVSIHQNLLKMDIVIQTAGYEDTRLKDMGFHGALPKKAIYCLGLMMLKSVSGMYVAHTSKAVLLRPCKSSRSVLCTMNCCPCMVCFPVISWNRWILGFVLGFFINGMPFARDGITSVR